MLVPTFLTQALSAGALAKSAVGAAVAVATVTGAAAADVLPEPVQDTVAAVVEGVSPLEVPDSTDVQPGAPADGVVGEAPAEPVEDVEQPPAEEPPAEPAAFDAAAWAEGGPEAYESFGAWVREGARAGAFSGEEGRFGAVVSGWAQRKHLDAEDLAAEGVEPSLLPDAAEAVAEPTTGAAGAPTAVATSPRAGDRPAANRGSGNGNSRSGGNGGEGNPGRGNGRG